MTRKFLTAVALSACLAALAPVQAQEAPGADTLGLGQESANWGLTPFFAVPVILLGPEATQQLRDLEDVQLRERRALEDRFAQEMRELMRTQAADRDALVQQLSGGPLGGSAGQ